MSVTNGAALVGWVMSRTVGLPLLHPGVEVAGTADVLTAGLEVAALVAAVALVRGRVPGDATWRTLPIGLAVAGVFALGASATAVAALGSSGGHGQGEVRATSGGDTHGHEDAVAGEVHASEESSGLARQPGTLPANLHRHRPGVYHLHDNIDLHEHPQRLVHVHTSASTGPLLRSAPAKATEVMATAALTTTRTKYATAARRR